MEDTRRKLSQQQLYRVEDPTDPTLAGSFTRLRNGINGLLLDEGKSFVDKVSTLAATQRPDDHRTYHVDPIISKLCEIGRKPVMIGSSGILVVGVLDEYEPWNFFNGAQEGQPANPDLMARFTSAYRVSHTVFCDHESYGQTSVRSETSPSAEEIAHKEDDPDGVIELAAGLPYIPYGSEHILDKMGTFASSLTIGTMAMHEKIAASSVTAKEKASLHAAVTNAFGKMGVL